MPTTPTKGPGTSARRVSAEGQAEVGNDLTSETRSLRFPLVGTLGLALLAVVAVAFVFNDPDRSADRNDRLSTEPGATQPVDSTPDPSDPAGTTEGGLPDDGPTGFYVPGDLPEGWTVQFTELTNPWPERCPCETTVWRNGDGAEISSQVSRSQEPFWLPDFTSPDQSEYREIPGGYVGVDSGEVRAKWIDGEVTKSLHATGVDTAVIEEIALAWTGDEPPESPVGFEHVWTGTTPEFARYTELYWRIGAGDGRNMVVHITPWPFAEPIDPEVQWPGVEQVVLPGNGMAVVQVPEWTEPHMEGLWPGGAHVTVAGNKGEFNSYGPYLTAEEMRDVAGGFRPASAEEWAAYVEAQIPAVDDPETYDDEAAIAQESHAALAKPRLTDLRVSASDATEPPG